MESTLLLAQAELWHVNYFKYNCYYPTSPHKKSGNNERQTARLITIPFFIFQEIIGFVNDTYSFGYFIFNIFYVSFPTQVCISYNAKKCNFMKQQNFFVHIFFSILVAISPMSSITTMEEDLFSQTLEARLSLKRLCFSRKLSGICENSFFFQNFSELWQY